MLRDTAPKEAFIAAAYFHGGERNDSWVFQELSKRRIAAKRLQSSSPQFRRFARLALPEESVVAVEVSLDDVSAVTALLEELPRSAVFVSARAPGSGPVESQVGDLRGAAGDLILFSNRLQSTARKGREYLINCARLGHNPSPAGQWIVDNLYLIRTGLSDFHKSLKRLTKNLPPERLEALMATARLAAEDAPGKFSEGPLADFLIAAQSEREMTSAELWSIPLFLRLAFFERISNAASRCGKVQEIRDAALLWSNRLGFAAASGDGALRQMMTQLDDEPFACERTFSVALAEGLQDREAALEAIQPWILKRHQVSVTDLVRSEHERESTDALQASRLFTSLKSAGQIQYSKVFEAVSAVEAELSTDPSGIYSRSDAATRARCRNTVSRIARQTRSTESDIARRAVAMARRDGTSSNGVLHYLIADGLKELETAAGYHSSIRLNFVRGMRRHSTAMYVCSTVALTAGILIVALGMAWDAGVHQPALLAILGALAAFPISELAIQILHSLIINAFPPEALPKLDFQQGIPADAATLVVVPMMLSSKETALREAEKLEVRYLANRDPNVTYSLFSDFVDAPEATMPADAELLKAARAAIQGMNEKYGGNRFVLFHRPRSWSPTQQQWIGRERKRGKIEELNALLCGHGASNIVAAGQPPDNIRYVICLDADTQLPPGTASRLVETIAHPLNQVRTNPVTGIRQSGFAIVQPRVGISLPGAMASRFTRVFSDSHGTDPYCMVVSDAQQDLCGEAIFHGKAIYDVRAFEQILNGCFPRESILSHDLIEGAYVGVGFASDVELLEGLPLDYPSYAKRQHRWIRGDWQIAPWIFPNIRNEAGEAVANPLSRLNRWRIFDNLRRSLVPIASLLLVIFGWFVSVAPAVWSLVLALTVGIPALVPILDRWTRHLEGTVHSWRGAADDLVRAGVMITFLPHQAWLSADAIARACYRSRWSKRNLLEWQTAEASEQNKNTYAEKTMRQMFAISAGSGFALIALALEGSFAPTFLYLGVWICSPWLMRWLGERGSIAGKAMLSEKQTAHLRTLARKTWRYFDDLVGEESNWLPPDNSQLALRTEVAKRTSPTNIGLWLNATLAAWDFGYLPAEEFISRCTKTLETVGKLSKYEGHLLNWYNTETLAPLQPEYVSTVDSGNFIASLWVLAQGCRDVAAAPILGGKSLRGLRDTIDTLRQSAGADPSLPVPIQILREASSQDAQGVDRIGQLRLLAFHSERLRAMKKWTPRAGDETTYWALRLASELDSWNSVVERYLGWMELVSSPPDALVSSLGEPAVVARRTVLHSIPSLRDLAAGPSAELAQLLSWREQSSTRPNLRDWLESVASAFDEAHRNAIDTLAKLDRLAAEATAVAKGIRMDFLYDPARRLFGIGYAVGQPVAFEGHYDLLASECRLATLVAIAKGDVPVETWFCLGRQPGAAGQGGLLSWSGTMFEYLMPSLFTELFEDTLLAHACEQAIAAQIAFAKERDLPWGISEAAYSALDSNKTYQYKAFGIPQLALNPNADPGPVVSPYSTMLALQLRPQEAYSNLLKFEQLGIDGAMGLYEAIDYTRPKQESDQQAGVPIYTYMAHHQGMSLLALCNMLCAHGMQRRFHADVRIRAVESLLFERVPIVRPDVPEKVQPAMVLQTVAAPDRRWTTPPTLPKIHLNSNGRYSVMVTSNGGGYSRWKDFDVSRWRADSALDGWGTWLWVKDMRSGDLWSPAPKPNGAKGEGSIEFSCDRASFSRRVHGVEVKAEIAVATDDDAELRRITVSNRSLRQRSLELTSYLELALAPHGADVAHPVFSKMFIETEYPEDGLLLARRRPRSPEEAPIWAAYLVLGATAGLEFETDRNRFLGRAGTFSHPVALDEHLTGTVGRVIDPIFSFRIPLRLESREQHTVTLVTIAASSREELMDVVRKYRRAESAAHAFEMIWTRTQLEFRFLRIGAAAAHRYQDLAGYMLYPSERLRALPYLEADRLGQSALWKYGISGDRPILAVTAADEQALGLVQEVLLAHSYWRMLGLAVDLLIFSREPQSYDTPLRKRLDRLIHSHTGWPTGTREGSVFVLNWQDLLPEERTHLLSVARVNLSGHQGSLQQQLLVPASESSSKQQSPLPPVRSYEYDPVPGLERFHRKAFNGVGGFSDDGREYVIDLVDGAVTPAPWANVLANDRFGTVVTEGGLGFSWRDNSQMNRLTTWHNDPLADTQSETIYLRDDDTGAVWSATPRPIRELAPYRIRHGQGYTSWEHTSHGIELKLTAFVGRSEPVKLLSLQLKNTSGRERHLSATYFAELVLGALREQQCQHVVTSFDAQAGMLCARQAWSEQFSAKIAFAACEPRATSFTADRRTFWGARNGDEPPASLTSASLDNRTGAGLDPCIALQVALTLKPGERRDLVFTLGQADSADEALSLARQFTTATGAHAELANVRAWWDSQFEVVQVETPHFSTDVFLNRWLLYQSLACRLWARSAVYQSGGAVGFRDQLQDSLALIYAQPALTRAHILRAASRQFLEGDVQHWWHAGSGLGVRTRCSDDLLWLPWVLTRYLSITQDACLLDESASFLEGPVLAEGQQEMMFAPTISNATATVWEHCVLAIEHASRFGEHGLPLMGNGDWNDGMNNVGAGGKGESVWLAWFLLTVLDSWIPLAETRNATLASTWRARATRLQSSIEQNAWDGEWYLRAFFDDGSPLGSHRNAEAQIDSLPQSWAALSGRANPQRVRQALAATKQRLLRPQDGLALLFTPPFDRSSPNPGYIMGYPPGMRENGGQYTHAAVWLAQALARVGDGAGAVDLLQMINPAERSRTSNLMAKYRGEPYVVAADVSATTGREGAANWTWYTGSAGWMYRVWIEDILGFQLRGSSLSIRPAVPQTWERFTIRYRYGRTTWNIAVTLIQATEVAAVVCDSIKLNGEIISLSDDGREHSVEVRCHRQVLPVTAPQTAVQMS